MVLRHISAISNTGNKLTNRIEFCGKIMESIN
jgi:hypothetical protein